MKLHIQLLILALIGPALIWSTAEAQIHVITNGDVGVGTSSPTSKLHVLGTFHVDGSSDRDVRIDNGTIYFDRSTGVSRIIQNGGRQLHFATGEPAGSWSDVLELYQNGNARFNNQLEVDGLVTLFSGINGNLLVSGDVVADGDVYADGVKLTSDARLKTDVRVLGDSIAKIAKLRGVAFKRVGDEGKTEHFGVLAQDVEKVFPGAVSTRPDGMKAVSYTDLIAPLIEAVKEQQKTIEKAETSNAQLRERIEQLENKQLAFMERIEANELAFAK